MGDNLIKTIYNSEFSVLQQIVFLPFIVGTGNLTVDFLIFFDCFCCLVCLTNLQIIENLSK